MCSGRLSMEEVLEERGWGCQGTERKKHSARLLLTQLPPRPQCSQDSGGGSSPCYPSPFVVALEIRQCISPKVGALQEGMGEVAKMYGRLKIFYPEGTII